MYSLSDNIIFMAMAFEQFKVPVGFYVLYFIEAWPYTIKF